ncbi:uncharacterized protein MONBRDRAFT_33470 [Monosiga brevicollis MX1]|uniref:Ras GTPase-activating protein n=1 Tax=Monosiga brevicollis TaxID=81824 RepID=A9V5K0_MONBE|nr:uncharacterized protein MONBRDRAFT_33470 [Monosiga brevicollis MX1]EDQ87132.1 predicted protein [Monosiga brevicollis MX1]|eukprot:XP_001748075.1 hypothetical protein [Monosiga brevicollis MX1]
MAILGQVCLNALVSHPSHLVSFQLLAAAQSISRLAHGTDGVDWDRHLQLNVVEWNPKAYALESGCKYYVLLQIDGDLVASTRALAEDRPFWQEDVRVRIPEDFELIRLVLYARSERTKDEPIAMVTLDKREMLAEGPLDKWLPLRVMGKVNIDIEIQAHRDIQEPAFQRAAMAPDTLMAKIMIIEGATFRLPNLYALITLDQNAVSGVYLHTPDAVYKHAEQVCHTKVFRRDRDPIWCETFVLPVTPKQIGVAPVVRVSVWQALEDQDDRLLGFSVVPIESKHLATTRATRCKSEGAASTLGALGEWFAVQSETLQQQVLLLLEKVKEETAEVLPELGSLRIKAVLAELQLLPIDNYECLQTFLREALEYEPFHESPILELAQRVKNLEKLARTLLLAYQHLDRDIEFAIKVAQHDIDQCSSAPTLFRGNTLATKVVEQYLRMNGSNMLWYTLSQVLNEVLTHEVALEINPDLVSSPAVLEQNQFQLKQLVEQALIDMVSSTSMVTDDIKVIMTAIATKARQRFPEDSTTPLRAVSGFIFLRFFAAAILNPQSFDLCQVIPTPAVKRTLTLISKLVQSLGNLGTESNLKEAFMKDILKNVHERQSGRVRFFLDKLSSLKDHESATRRLSSAYRPAGSLLAVIKEGFLTKRGLGRKKSVMGMNVSGLKNLKRRFVILSNEGLSYHKDKGGPALGKFTPQDIIGVELAQEDALGEFAFQVLLAKQQPLYLAAENAVDRTEWILSLRRYCENNMGLSPTYHPGLYAGAWTCCASRDDEAPGCRPCTRESSERFPRLRGFERPELRLTMEQVYQFCLEAQGALQAETHKTVTPGLGTFVSVTQRLYLLHEEKNKTCHRRVLFVGGLLAGSPTARVSVPSAGATCAMHAHSKAEANNTNAAVASASQQQHAGQQQQQHLDQLPRWLREQYERRGVGSRSFQPQALSPARQLAHNPTHVPANASQPTPQADIMLETDSACDQALPSSSLPSVPQAQKGDAAPFEQPASIPTMDELQRRLEALRADRSPQPASAHKTVDAGARLQARLDQVRGHQGPQQGHVSSEADLAERLAKVSGGQRVIQHARVSDWHDAAQQEADLSEAEKADLLVQQAMDEAQLARGAGLHADGDAASNCSDAADDWLDEQTLRDLAAGKWPIQKINEGDSEPGATLDAKVEHDSDPKDLTASRALPGDDGPLSADADMPLVDLAQQWQRDADKAQTSINSDNADITTLLGDAQGLIAQGDTDQQNADTPQHERQRTRISLKFYIIIIIILFIVNVKIHGIALCLSET